MAMMSLKVNRGPSLNLSGIFKAAMPDPDLAIKAALANSTIWGQEHENKLRDQQAEYARQQAAQEAQKTRDLEVLSGVRKAAVPGIERGLVGAIPLPANQPVPVELSRIAGPVNGVPVSAPPAIVDQRFYDDEVAGAKARASLYPYIAKDATDLSKGYFNDVGGETLAAGLTPGGPAAVNLTPDKLRLAATLTGQMPTMSTALTKDDTVGADMATRQAVQTAAGKLPYDIAQDRAKAQAEADVKVAARPLGDSELAIYRSKLAELEAKPPGQLTSQEQALLPLLKDAVGKATQTSLDANNRIVAPDPANPGAVAVVPGSEPTVGSASEPYGDLKSLSGKNYKIVTDLMDKIDNGGTLTRAEMRLYSGAFNQLWGDVTTTAQDASGVSHPQTIRKSAPFGFYAPEDIMKAGGKKPGGAAPSPAITDSGLIPSITPEGGVVVPDIGGVTGFVPEAAAGVPAEATGVVADPIATPTRPTGSGTVTVDKKPIPGLDIPSPATVDEAKAKELSPALARAHAGLRDTPAGNLPDAWFNYWANPSDPGLLQQIIEQQVPAAQREYAQKAAQFGLVLYRLSGAAFPGGEYPRIMRTMIPTAADNINERRGKLQLQAEYLNGLVNNGWARVPELRQRVRDQLKQELGLEFSDLALVPPVKLPEDAAPAAVAPASDPSLPPIPPNLSEVGGKPEYWQKYTPAARAFFIEQAAKKAKAK